MTESRQQRRARERAERKATSRPGPNPRHVPEVGDAAPGSTTIEVDVRWNADRQRPEESYWSVEWGEIDSECGFLESGEIFDELIEMVLTDLAERWHACELKVEWTLDSAAQAQCESSAIDLPVRLPTAD